jgi:hypothetical protein
VEWDRQLNNAQEVLNDTTYETWLERRDAFTGDRSPEVLAEQRAVRQRALDDRIDELLDEGLNMDDAQRQAKEWIETQHAVHRLDAVAGGDPLDFDGVGDASVNSSMGSQWRTRIPGLEEAAREHAATMTPEQLRTTLLNVRISG